MHYLKKSQRHLAEMLALKTFLKKRLEIMKHEKRAIEAYLKIHDTSKENVSDLSLISLGARDLITSAGMANIGHRTLSEDVKKWQNANYRRCPYYPEALTIPVSESLYVRSKSEALIASILQEKGIPFRYECELSLSGTLYYPDFTIRHPISGRVMLWEHFGLLDKPDYANRAYSKLRIYSENGFIPMINLIITCETESVPLDLRLVSRLVDHYFL